MLLHLYQFKNEAELQGRGLKWLGMLHCCTSECLRPLENTKAALISDNKKKNPSV